MTGKCKGCGKWDDLRLGYCWDCATAGEERAARRGVLAHIGHGYKHLAQGHFTTARICFQWAWERLTSTGDYRPGGKFERFR